VFSELVGAVLFHGGMVAHMNKMINIVGIVIGLGLLVTLLVLVATA
jgi:hypothetical protein